MLTVITGYFHGTPDTVPPPWHTFYDFTWVERLYRGFARNLEQPFRFICLAEERFDDQGRGFPPLPILQIEFQRPDLGFMALNEIFRPDLEITRGLFVGLDTVITGNVDHIANSALLGDLLMPRDPFSSKHLCNAVVSFTEAGAQRIWKEYGGQEDEQAKRHRIANWARPGGYPSEFIFLRNVLRNQPDVWLDEAFPGEILSYKTHVTKLREGPTTERDTQMYISKCRQPVELPGNARIVYFHGRPKPHELPDPWLKEHWT